MAHWQPQPYEENQGQPQAASSAEMAAFYQDMERKEVLERKLSKRKSSSLWSRKSKRLSTLPVPVVPVLTSASAASSTDDVRSMEQLEQAKHDLPPPLPTSRSIVPEALADLPGWYNNTNWSQPAYYRQKFPMHNPVGPRHYRNYHLLPQSLLRGRSRPPSVFSPLFPPIAAAPASGSIHSDDNDDSSRKPAMSRSPSNSPLPTPSSSQTRVEDSGKPRSRKTSQTAHDGVDLMDVTDPWGTNYHHTSPYDVGLGSGPVSPEVDNAQTRSRQSTTTTATASTTNKETPPTRKTITPSPLSQSTSALHLDPGQIQMPRKLSKRRTVSAETGRNAVSMPATPIDSGLPHDVPASAPPTSYNPSLKSAKRGSVLGRLVKKFSILRKDKDDSKQARNRRQSFVTGAPVGGLSRQPSPQKIPPQSVSQPYIPLTQPDSSFSVMRPPRAQEDPSNTGEAGDSSLELEEPPFSMGRLTVANPDALSEASLTPMQREAPLPHPQLLTQPPFDVMRNIPSPPLAGKPKESDVASLPIHLPPPELGAVSPQPPQESLQARDPSIRAPSSSGHHSVPSESKVQDEPQALDDSWQAVEPIEHLEDPRQQQQQEPIKSPEPSLAPAPASGSSSHDQQPREPSPVPGSQSQRSQYLHREQSYDFDIPTIPSETVMSSPVLSRRPESSHTRRSVEIPRRSERSPEKRTRSPERWYRSERSPEKKHRSPERQQQSPEKRHRSPERRQRSPERTHRSPERQRRSPEKKQRSPERHQRSPEKKQRSPERHQRSPEKKQRSPERHHRSPERRHRSPERTHRSSEKLYQVPETQPIAPAVPEKRRSYEKRHSKPPAAPPKTKAPPPAIPFPHTPSDVPAYLTSLISYDDVNSSPLSAASMEVNPPTPYVADHQRLPSTPDEPPPALPPKTSYPDFQSSSGSMRQTEKFKLVRSNSGDVFASTETIKAEGESWEVMEQRRSPTKSKDRREHKKEEKERSRAKRGDAAEGQSESRKPKVSRKAPRSAEAQEQPSNVDQRPPPPPRDEPQKVNVDKPQPAPPPPTPGPSTSKALEPRRSHSIRPTSEVPSAADLNALRAKEAWEMERMWKARSMYGVESNGAAPAATSIHTLPPRDQYQTAPGHAPAHGSSHTSYVVQNSFQPAGSHIYHSMPSAPPPIIYGSMPPYNSGTTSYSSPDVRPSSSSIRAPLNNPLPEPPRESPYLPSPIPLATNNLDGSPSRNSDYWNKYPGITTTAH